MIIQNDIYIQTIHHEKQNIRHFSIDHQQIRDQTNRQDVSSYSTADTQWKEL